MARIIFDKNTLIVHSDRYQGVPRLGSKGINRPNGVAQRVVPREASREANMLGKSEVHLLPQDWKPSPTAEATYRAIMAVYSHPPVRPKGDPSKAVATRGVLYVAPGPFATLLGL